MTSQTVRCAPNRFGKRDNDRSGIGNIILRGLPAAEWTQIFASLEFVRLKFHQVLHEADEAIKSGYFLNEGMSSVLTVQPDGESVEVGLIGREGLVGLQRYSMILGIQSTQLAACNRLHDVEERLARWLLMSHDRKGGKTLLLTQEFLVQMLGTRRSTVSVAASVLQKAGLVSYTRGNVTILNKSKLEDAACDCYEIIRQQKNRWQAETS